MRTLQRIHELAQADPGRPALYCRGHLHSYRELADAISSIHRKIQGSGLGDEQLIGVLAGDDFLTYASVFAILANGSAYVPLNKKQPGDRLVPVLEDAGLRLVLSSETHDPLNDAVQRGSGDVRILDTQDSPPAPLFSPPRFPDQ